MSDRIWQVDAERCPNCKEVVHAQDPFAVMGDNIMQCEEQYECKHCGAEWLAIYTYTGTNMLSLGSEDRWVP